MYICRSPHFCLSKSVNRVTESGVTNLSKDIDISGKVDLVAVIVKCHAVMNALSISLVFALFSFLTAFLCLQTVSWILHYHELSTCNPICTVMKCMHSTDFQFQSMLEFNSKLSGQLLCFLCVFFQFAIQQTRCCFFHFVKYTVLL